MGYNEFHYTVKRLESHIRNRQFEQATVELKIAYLLQPTNPYLRAFDERIRIESAQEPRVE